MWDIVVIGLGGVGSFALRAASQLRHTSKSNRTNQSHHVNKTMKVLGIEKFNPCHSYGSSHGHSRIYRHAYFEHSNYVPLIIESTRQFQLLQKTQNTRLLEECGMLIMEEKKVTKTHKTVSLIQNCLESANKHQIKVDLLSSNQLIGMYPQFKNLDGMNGLLEYNAGFVRPELSIEAALSVAKENGAVIWDNHLVENIREVSTDEHDSFVEISLTFGSGNTVIQSKKVIIAAGAWTAELIPSWSRVLKVTRQIQAWIDTRKFEKHIPSTKNPLETEHSLYHPKQMPTWLISSSQLETSFYGIPIDPCSSDYPSHIKIALHGRNVEVDPNLKNPPVTNEEVKELEDAFRLFFQYHDYNYCQNQDIPIIDDSKSCMYTMTPDGHFLLGKPKGYDNVYAAAGLSGHGFKMVPSLGQALVDMAFLGKVDFDVEFLSPSRFGV
jgi:sarcosine oxidase